MHVITSQLLRGHNYQRNQGKEMVQLNIDEIKQKTHANVLKETQ